MPPANKRNGFMSSVGHSGHKQQRSGRVKAALAVANPEQAFALGSLPNAFRTCEQATIALRALKRPSESDCSLLTTSVMVIAVAVPHTVCPPLLA
jgi:hypothetical protein